MIASISYVKEVMGELKAKKKYGQNFLIDANIVDNIAKRACDKELKTIEIGPGLGALTERLLVYSKDVDAYEIDKDMYERLVKTLSDERLHVYLEDFLKCDLSRYSEKVNICANLPYYVTTPILFKIFESELDINKITVMVQKEVADRLKAAQGTEDYGALSIEVQYLYDVKAEMNVPASVFYPAPKVESTVVSFTPNRARDAQFEKGFFELVKNCFRMRRKTLHNNLKDLYDEETIARLYAECGFKDNVRAQELGLTDFLNMYKMLY